MWLTRRTRPEDDESVAAVKESLEKLELTVQRTAAVAEVSQALRSLRERNHFAEQLESIMGGPR